jgi:hypothetical protein
LISENAPPWAVRKTRSRLRGTAHRDYFSKRLPGFRNVHDQLESHGQHEGIAQRRKCRSEKDLLDEFPSENDGWKLPWKVLDRRDSVRKFCGLFCDADRKLM